MLEEKLVSLALLRDRLAFTNENIGIIECRLSETEDGKALAIFIEETRELEKQVEAEIQALREEAIEHFRATGDVRPHEAVQIKIYKTVKYDDQTALKWCEERIPELVKKSIDKTKFEKVAKELQLDFVEIIDEPRASIATDLSIYFRKDGDEL